MAGHNGTNYSCDSGGSENNGVDIGIFFFYFGLRSLLRNFV